MREPLALAEVASHLDQKDCHIHRSVCAIFPSCTGGVNETSAAADGRAPSGIDECACLAGRGGFVSRRERGLILESIA